MKKISIEMLCPSSFIDKDGKGVDYLRVLVREESENGVKWSLEKGSSDLLDLGDVLGYHSMLLYDKYGRICGTR